MSDAAAPTLTVAVAQVESRLGDLEGNADRHIALLHQARVRGVQCVLFPELSLTGHALGRGAPEHALDAEHALVKALVKASGPMLTTFGLVEEGPGVQFHNSAFTAAGGRILHIHRKVNLAARDGGHGPKMFAAGRYLETFTIARRWRAATLIGGDMWNPAVVHLMAVKGATVLMVPASSADNTAGACFDNPDGWAMVCRHSAMMHGLPVMFANRVGGEEGHHCWGGSFVMGPTGDVLARAGDGEGLTVAELDYNAVRQARFNLPTVRDSNLDLMQREITRVQGALGVPEAVRRN